MLNASVWILIAAGAAMFLVIGGLSMMSHHYTLGNIKSRTVGDGQHGTARWATDKEIRQTYAHVPFKVREWRRGQNLPMEQGVILGCKGKPQELTALVDSNDIHCLMIGASGIKLQKASENIASLRRTSTIKQTEQNSTKMPNNCSFKILL